MHRVRAGKPGSRFQFTSILLENRIHDRAKNCIVLLFSSCVDKLLQIREAGVSPTNSDLLNRVLPTRAQTWRHSYFSLNRKAVKALFVAIKVPSGLVKGASLHG